MSCAWEVVAGIIPGEVMSEYTQRWALSGEDRHNLEKFIDTEAAATAYARRLQLECMTG